MKQSFKSIYAVYWRDAYFSSNIQRLSTLPNRLSIGFILYEDDEFIDLVSVLDCDTDNEKILGPSSGSLIPKSCILKTLVVGLFPEDDK